MALSRVVEDVLTRRIGLAVLGAVLLPATALILVVIVAPAALDPAVKVIDAAFKCGALLAGGVWALNRHLVQRVDAAHLKVEAEVSRVSASSFGSQGAKSLLLVHLRVLNEAKTLFPAGTEGLEALSVQPAENGVSTSLLHRWPSKGFHPAGSIEPGSWSAISEAISMERDLAVIQVYYERRINDQPVWTWHRAFDLNKT